MTKDCLSLSFVIIWECPSSFFVFGFVWRLLFCSFFFCNCFFVQWKLFTRLNHNNGVIIICECQFFKINFKMRLLWDIQNLMFSIYSTWFTIFVSRWRNKACFSKWNKVGKGYHKHTRGKLTNKKRGCHQKIRQKKDIVDMETHSNYEKKTGIWIIWPLSYALLPLAPLPPPPLHTSHLFAFH